MGNLVFGREKRRADLNGRPPQSGLRCRESERLRERKREAEETAKPSCVVLVFFEPVEISCLLKARVFLKIGGR